MHLAHGRIRGQALFRKALDLYERDKLHAGDTFTGPAIISEYSSATILPPGDVLRVDAFKNLVIEVYA